MRNRQRKNWPGSARSRSKFRPEISTDTMPGASGRTDCTVNRCRADRRSGVITRYHTSSAPTTAYNADQATRAAVFPSNAGPSANWWLNASAIAR